MLCWPTYLLFDEYPFSPREPLVLIITIGFTPARLPSNLKSATDVMPSHALAR